jgi:hypothetical protein
MSIRTRTALAVLGLLAGATVPGRAQTSHSHLGIHGLYNTTFEDFGVGAQFSTPVAHHLELYPSFDVYFESPGTMWEGNLDFKYRAFGERWDWSYIGTGLNVHRQDINGATLTRGGWNLFFGAESIRGQVHPFAEARVTVTDHTRFQLQAGFNVTLGHHKH